MPRLSPKLRERIVQAAGNRCEYCQTAQAMTMARFHIDHITPRVAGGTTEFDNLCLSCPFCNEFKAQQRFARDPRTGRRVRLFHPRQDRWHSHFRWNASGTKVVGLTAREQATVAALNLNHPLAQQARSFWVASGIHPPE